MATDTKKPKQSKTKETAKKNSVDEEVLRKRKVPKYKSFRLSKKIPHPSGPIVSTTALFKKTARLILQNKKPLIGIMFVYVILTVVFVRGFTSPLNIAELRNEIQATEAEEVTSAGLVTTAFASLLGSSTGTSSDTASLYQTILYILISLAVIWVFRQYAAGKKPTAKEAFYTGMYPIIPFLIVVFVLVLQLIPAFIGTFMYETVRSGELATSSFEQALWVLFLALTILLSIYMVCSSLFALYVVTLPGVTPMQALRSTRQLVFSRRQVIFRRLLALVIVGLLLLVLLVVPAIYFLPGIAPWFYFVISLTSIVYIHAYLFSLYKELL